MTDGGPGGGRVQPQFACNMRPTERPPDGRKVTMLDDHPYVALYLLGCAMVFALTVVKLTLHWALAWITKSNVLAANLKKLQPLVETPFWTKVGKFFGTVALEAALSWINVAVGTWQILALLLRTVREALSSSPESVQRLRFPLKNNPDLPAESVWAYLFALSITVGTALPDEEHLTSELDDISTRLPRFDRSAALQQLEHLGVVKAAVLSAVAMPADEDDTEP